MEQMIDELKKVIPFKDVTGVGDIVLVAGMEPRLLVYALVTDITRDTGKRDEWWFVTIHFLTVPPHKAVWILRTAQMTGQEIFTMDGAERFVKAVDFGQTPPRPVEDRVPEKGGKPPSLRLVK
ncbi:MAG: hypothetical protein L3J03_07140 [Desulfobacterales bacterium]|nr:hypothetical protein [Desulfobacterales bacterium]